MPFLLSFTQKYWGWSTSKRPPPPSYSTDPLLRNPDPPLQFCILITKIFHYLCLTQFCIAHRTLNPFRSTLLVKPYLLGICFQCKHYWLRNEYEEKRKYNGNNPGTFYKFFEFFLKLALLLSNYSVIYCIHMPLF